MFSVLGPGARTTVLGRLIGFRVPFSASVPGPPFSDGSSAFGSRSRPRCPTTVLIQLISFHHHGLAWRVAP